MNNFVIETGADGELVSQAADEVRALVRDAMKSERLVLHFHGGLVSKAKGMEIAAHLHDDYSAAGAESIFFVWHAGALEIVRGNVLEIIQEAIFQALVRKILRWGVGLARAGGRGGMLPPSQGELEAELAHAEVAALDPGAEPEAGPEAREPFAGVSIPDDVDDLPPGLAQTLVAELVQDQRLQRAIDAAITAMHDQTDKRTGDQPGNRAGNPTGQPGQGAPGRSRGPGVSRNLEDDTVLRSAQTPAQSPRFDRVLLKQIDSGAPQDGDRGLVSSALLAKKAVEVLRAVISRYHAGTDSGLYCTAVEELCRAFYAADLFASVWSAMKNETQNAFEELERGARLAVDTICEELDAGANTRITLVGHSTGAVFIDNLLAYVKMKRADGFEWPAENRMQVVLLAPAATTMHFADAWDSSNDVVGRTRMFTMTPDAEIADRVAGRAYPRSLLYLVSGVLERLSDSASGVVPLIGLSRYQGPSGAAYAKSGAGQAARLAVSRTFFEALDGGQGRVVLSPTGPEAPPGARAGALKHGDFDDDDLVIKSIQHMVSTWQG